MCCIKCAKATASFISKVRKKLIDKISVSAHTNIFLCSYQRYSNMVICPLNLLPGSNITVFDQSQYIRRWTLMNKVQMKGLFPLWDRWVHLHLSLTIPFVTSYLLICMNLFVQSPNQHTRHYKAFTKKLHIIYHLPMICLYQLFRLVQSCQLSIFRLFLIDCFNRCNRLT